jgi:hypothetical protein
MNDSNDNNDIEYISDLDNNNCSDLSSIKEENNMTTTNTDQKLTFQLTTEQLQLIEELRLTTIANNVQSTPKTQQQQIHQIIEYGIRALMQQRKQYQRQREALRMMRSAK